MRLLRRDGLHARRTVHRRLVHRARRPVLAAAASAAAAPPTPPAAIATIAVPILALDALHLDRLLGRHAEQRAVRQPAKRHAEARRHVADSVERAVVGHDLDHVARPRPGQPHAGGHRDPEIAPVAHADRRRAVHEPGAVARQQPRRVVTDHAPVADSEEVGTPAGAVHREVRQHARDVLGAARVLHVEEDGPPAGRQRPCRLGRRHARGQRGLRRGER